MAREHGCRKRRRRLQHRLPRYRESAIPCRLAQLRMGLHERQEYESSSK